MAHRRSLGFARDDRKERVIVRKGQLLEERALAKGAWDTFSITERTGPLPRNRSDWCFHEDPSGAVALPGVEVKKA